MASGDTRTQQYLDIAANGSRADLPTETCCETRTQTLIRGVAERIITEEETRAAADRVLQGEIDEIRNNPDVFDIVATKADLDAYDTSTITDNDIIRVLRDEDHNNASTYYRWDASDREFDYIGEVGDYYTKAQTDALLATKADKATTYTKTEVDTALSGKQDVLTAGTNIQINGTTISATDTTYTAGNGLTLTGTEFSADTSVLATQTDLAGKQNTLTAGTGIDITNDVISATGGGGITELTSADYNYPASNPIGIALWTLDSGIYQIYENDVRVYASTTDSLGLFQGTVVVSKSSSGHAKIALLGTGSNLLSNISIYGVNSTGGYTSAQGYIPKDRIVQTTGTSTTDVMSQNAVTSMVYADPSTKVKVQIGNSAVVGGNYSIAIGNYSTMDGVAAGAISLGAYSRANATGEMNIGSSSTAYGYNDSNYRLLTGLYDGQSAHDAVTVGQLKTAIINGGTTAPTTATVGAVGTLYSYVDTTGTTPEPHLMVCTVADTVTPSYTWVDVMGSVATALNQINNGGNN